MSLPVRLRMRAWHTSCSCCHGRGFFIRASRTILTNFFREASGQEEVVWWQALELLFFFRIAVCYAKVYANKPFIKLKWNLLINSSCVILEYIKKRPLPSPLFHRRAGRGGGRGSEAGGRGREETIAWNVKKKYIRTTIISWAKSKAKLLTSVMFFQIYFLHRKKKPTLFF